MRYFVIIGILCAFAPATFAQAADPKAIDLSGKMDTIARGSQNVDLGGFLNVRTHHQPPWEDFELKKSDHTKMRFGGPLIFDTTNNPPFANGGYDPQFYGDFDGDGIGDIIADDGVFFKGKSLFPYFDTATSGCFVRDPFYPKVIDFDEDGTEDFIICAGDHRIRVFNGGSSFGKIKYLYASDSVQLPDQIYSMEVGKFNPQQKPMIISYAGNKIYLIKQTGNSFSQDSVIIVSDSALGGIIVTNLYATDITGDGITDLIVSDGLHIYIFKGGDNFGTYQLTSQNAFYTIKSPRLTDFANYGFIRNFGANGGYATDGLRACGDLTGTGIPYLAVGAEVNESGYFKGYEFFYAGGKALDSLYDAVVGYVDQGLGGIDTLHSINTSGRTVCLLNDFFDQNFGNLDLDFLMSRDCENIPHKTNPNMVGVVWMEQDSLQLIAYPALANRFVKLHISAIQSEKATVEIFDLLGRRLDVREVILDAGENTEFYNTGNFSEGTYIARLKTSSNELVAKFIIHH